MANDPQWLKAYLDRIEDGVERSRQKQEESAVQIARIEERTQVSETRSQEMQDSQGRLVEVVNGITVKMAVAQAKAGGIAGMITGGLAALIIKLLEMWLGTQITN